MTDATELKEMKQNMCPIIACCCFEESCTASQMCDPLCMGTFKICCCSGSLASECCCITCSFTEPCWSDERGCCESAAKCLCLYSEVQFPPGQDIGCGCCGMVCCRSSDDKPPEEPLADQ
jgi:hypothetical protein